VQPSIIKKYVLFLSIRFGSTPIYRNKGYRMKSVFRLLPAATLALLSLPALASSVVYTNSVAFLADVAPGQYTENFDGLLNPPSGPFGFSGGAFNYSASAPSDLYLEGGFLGAAKDNDALTITFAGGNVRAIGKEFIVSGCSFSTRHVGAQTPIWQPLP
jgi:hypothetical protein